MPECLTIIIIYLFKPGCSSLASHSASDQVSAFRYQQPIHFTLLLHGPHIEQGSSCSTCGSITEEDFNDNDHILARRKYKYLQTKLDIDDADQPFI